MIKTLTKGLVREVWKPAGQDPNMAGNRAQESTPWMSGGFDWGSILDRDAARWKSASSAAQGGPLVLVANAMAADPGAPNVDTMLAVALTLRGAEVHLLLCDEALPACCVSHIDYVGPEEFVKLGPSRQLCGKCFSGAKMMFNPLGLPTHRYSDLITDGERQEARDLSSVLSVAGMKEYRMDGLKIGEHALAGALRFCSRGNLEGQPHGEAILRRYFNAALLTAFATRRLMDTFSFTCVSTLHGIYLPEGIIGEVARQKNVRVADWTVAYRKQTFIFSHDDTYHHTLLSEPTTTWENMTWTPETESQILDYLKSRCYGTQDWITYLEHPEEDIQAITAETGIDFSKPSIGLLTNVMWDAQLHYGGNAFPNMLAWVLETIRYFAKRPDLQLIIRVHPAELLGSLASRQPIIAEIRREFPTLPKNVFVIPPESPISTYTVMLKCNAVTIYGTKAGVELTSMGIPVIVAGEAWIRNKGVTFDASSREEYIELLNRLPLEGRLSKTVRQRACKYAYHFFFRRMIPLSFIDPTSAIPPILELSALDELLPGQSVGLDVICNGILNGSEFIYPAEVQPETIDESVQESGQIGENDEQVKSEARARASLRIVDILTRLGELERTRVHLLKVLQEFPWIATKSWARPSIAESVSRLALASDAPIATVRAFWAEVRNATNGCAVGTRLKMQPLLADLWRETAIDLWKIRSYQVASYAAAYAVFYDPTQLFRKALLKRFVDSLIPSS